MIVCKVREGSNGQKIVTIPKNSDIEKDEYVIIEPLKQGASNDKKNKNLGQ